DRNLERTTRVDDERPPSEAGRGGQCDASDGFRVEMTDDFDDDATFASGSQLAVELWEVAGKAGVHHATSYRYDGASAKVLTIVHTYLHRCQPIGESARVRANERCSQVDWTHLRWSASSM